MMTLELDCFGNGRFPEIRGRNMNRALSLDFLDEKYDLLRLVTHKDRIGRTILFIKYLKV